MAELGVSTIFTETTVSPALAQTIAAGLDGCAEVQIRSLYTGLLGASGSGADSNIEMMRCNVGKIAKGLR